MKYDVIVVGAGMSGLIAATKLKEEGKQVAIISHGQSCTSFTSGCVDLLGYFSWDKGVCLTKLENNLQKLINRKSTHPYSLVGRAAISESIDYFKELSKQMGYEYLGKGDHNYLLSTSFGTVKPTALIPPSMAEGDIRAFGNTLVVGIAELLDFSPSLVADGINYARKKLKVAGIWKSSGAIELGIEQKNITPLFIARWLENEDNLNAFAEKLMRLVANANTGGYKRIGLPAILGSAYSTNILDRLSSKLQCPIFEIPTGQPTVSGVRLNTLLLDGAKKMGVKVQVGAPVVDIVVEKDHMRVIVDSVARYRYFSCSQVILATGGVMGAPTLPIRELSNEQNIFLVGRNLPEYDPAVEKSGLGVALATGYAAGKAINEGKEWLKRGSYSEASC